MRPQIVSLQLSPDAHTPITLQIVESFKEAIRTGRIKPGEILPSTRLLAASLKVSRNTVLDAYDELAAEGYVVGRRGSGSYVADTLPDALEGTAPERLRDHLAFTLTAVPSIPDIPPTVLSCLTGQADSRLLPTLALARTYRKALESRASATPRQHDLTSGVNLRAHILELLEQGSGLRGTMANLLLTSGFQAALELVAGVLLSPGDVVAVEEMGARKHWDILRRSGADLEPVAVDEEGLDVEALEALAQRRPVRAVLLSPRCQYPTTVELSAPRRKALLRWAEAQGVALLECDAESGLHYGPLTPSPLAADDREGSVIYLGTFTKSLFPGLPLAHILAPTPLIARLASCQRQQGQEADPVFQGAMTELFLEGEFHRHLARLRTALLSRRDALHQALSVHLGERITYELPNVGTAIWIQVGPEVDVERWAERSVNQGVAFTVGQRYRFDGAPVHALRLGFASHQEDELEEIVRRMTAAWE